MNDVVLSNDELTIVVASLRICGFVDLADRLQSDQKTPLVELLEALELRAVGGGS